MARNRRNRNRLKIDPVVALIYTVLVFWGWLSIHSAVYNEEAASLFNLTQEYGKQLLFIGGSFIIILGILLSNYRLWTNFAPFWYILTLILLIGVLFVGKKIGGARSWYALGSFSLQPSEVAKFATALMLPSTWDIPAQTCGYGPTDSLPHRYSSFPASSLVFNLTWAQRSST